MAAGGQADSGGALDSIRDVGVRVGVTELKYVVLYPVYQIIRHQGGVCASSKQHASKQATSNQPHRALSGLQSRRGPKIKIKCYTLSGIIFRNFVGNNFLRSDPTWSETAI